MCEPHGFEYIEFPYHVYKLDKPLYGMKQAPRASDDSTSSLVEKGKNVKGKLFRGMIGSLLYSIGRIPYLFFFVGLCARFQNNPKQSHLKGCEENYEISQWVIEMTCAYGI